MVWGSRLQQQLLNTHPIGPVHFSSAATASRSSHTESSISAYSARTRVCETSCDKVVESLISQKIMNHDLLLINPALTSQSMPPLDKTALLALVDLLTKPMTLTGRPLKNTKTGELDSKPSFQATFSLVELFRYLELNGSHTTKGLINAINIVGGAVPWILSGASGGKKEWSTTYLESFFSELGVEDIKKNIPESLLKDFGKHPSDIDIRFIAPIANRIALAQFLEEVNNFIALKANMVEMKGITHGHGYSKWNTTIDTHGENENKRRRENKEKEEPIKKYSVIGFETTSQELGKNDFDFLFISQLANENLFVRDALRIPIKELVSYLIKAVAEEDGLTKFVQEIKDDKVLFKVIPESPYPGGGWQPVMDRLLGICRTKDKLSEFIDWAVLLSCYVRGKRSVELRLETSLVEQLCKIGAKEKYLFPFPIQEKLRQLEEGQHSTFPFLAGFGLKSILANHHNQIGALEALTLQACISLKQFDD